MRQMLILLILVLVGPGQVVASDNLPGDIELLKGYHATQEPGVDATILDIRKAGGPTIHFEVGMSEGSWADPEDQAKYAWYHEQTLHGHTIRVALIRRGLKTVWEPKDRRGRKPGNILLVTFLLGGADSAFTANFSAKVVNEKEMAEVLLMALSFDPDKLFSKK